MLELVKKYRFVAALLLLLLGLSGYFYRQTLALPPSNIHAWTQSDRWALAFGFIDNGFKFWLPQTSNLATTSGITGVDLPINEYAVAAIMSATGSDAPIIFRTYNLIFALLGSLFFYAAVQRFSGSKMAGAAVSIFAFTCPILVYYQAGFLPSTTSFAAALIGYYCYICYWESQNWRYFYWAVAWLTFAALMRTPFNIFLFALLVQQVLYFIKSIKSIDYQLFKQDFKQNFRPQLIAFFIAYAFIIGQYFWKSYVNNTYGSQFLTQIMPAASFAEFAEILAEVWRRWAGQLLTKAHNYLLLLAAFGIAWQRWHWRTASAAWKAMFLHFWIMVAGAICYFLLMSRQFIDHEYYFIDSFYLPIVWFFGLGAAGFFAKNSDKKSRLKSILKWFFALILLLLLALAARDSELIQQQKYAKTLWDRGELTRQNFENTALWLDSLGVEKSAKILVLDAYSTNAPLLALKRKGFTTVSTRRDHTEKALNFAFDYIVTQDIFFASDLIDSYPELIFHLQRVGGTGKISLYRYHRQPTNNTQNKAQLFAQLLGAPENITIANADSSAIISTKIGTKINKNTEFFSVFEPQNNINFSHIFIATQVDTAAKISDTKIVCSLTLGEQVLYYWEFPFRPNAENQANFCFVLPPAPADAVVKCYLWNPQQDFFTLVRLSTAQF